MSEANYRLKRDLVVDVDNECVTYRGHQIDFKADSKEPYKLLKTLVNEYPFRRKTHFLVEAAWNEVNKSNIALFYKKIQIIRASLPGGIALEGGRAKGYVLKVADGESEETPKDVQGQRPNSIVDRTWNRAMQLITNATRSITIVDSHYSEYRVLSAWVKEAADNLESIRGASKRRLKLSIYMTSPKTNFGAHRQLEVKRPSGSIDTYKRRLRGSHSSADGRAYEKKFAECVEGLIDLDEDEEVSVTVRIYEYPAMPSTRMIVVDGCHYLFGWYPLWKHNPSYPCLYLNDIDLPNEESRLVDALRGQINNIHKISDIVYPLPKRPSGSRHKTQVHQSD